jgi:adenosine deaminase
MAVSLPVAKLPPLVDLHCHIEGTIYPDTARKLAARNKVALPTSLIRPDSSYAWDDFSSFLKTYDQVAALVREPCDYRDIVFDHYARTAAMGLIYGEIFCSPDHGRHSGIAYPDMIAAMAEGLADARAQYGVEGRFIALCLRHLGPEKAVDTARTVARHPHPLVTGFGMAGDERMGSMADFAPAFDIARDAGLALTVHAGEVCGPRSIMDALAHLRPRRLGHGVRAIEDLALVEQLAEERIALEVCPGSNIALSLYPSRQDHPAARLFRAGCAVTLGADDPPFFATDIAREYEELAAASGLGNGDLRHISATAVQAAFCDTATRERLLRRLH